MSYDTSEYSQSAATKGNTLSDQAIQDLITDSTNFADEIGNSFGSSLGSTAMGGMLGQNIASRVTNCVSDSFASLLASMKTYLENRANAQSQQATGIDDVQDAVQQATTTDTYNG